MSSRSYIFSVAHIQKICINKSKSIVNTDIDDCIESDAVRQSIVHSLFVFIAIKVICRNSLIEPNERVQKI